MTFSRASVTARLRSVCGLSGDRVEPVGSAGRFGLPLDHDTHQSRYGETFVRVVAAAAGLVVAKPDPDYDGIDFFLQYPRSAGSPYIPQIDVQVKSARNPEASETHWRYRLWARHFNELAGVIDGAPRFLFLVVVPPNVHEYVEADADCLRLHRAGYWASLEDQEPDWSITAGKKVSVQVPKRNLLTVESLLELMVRPGVRVGSS